MYIPFPQKYSILNIITFDVSCGKFSNIIISNVITLFLRIVVQIQKTSGPGCSKLMTSLVNVSLKFLTLISEICQYFLSKKCEKAFAVQKLFSFFQQKISVYLVIKW